MSDYNQRLAQHHERTLAGAVECLAEHGWSADEARAVASIVPHMLRTFHPTLFGEIQRGVLEDSGDPARSWATPESLAWARTPSWPERLAQVAEAFALRRALWIVGQELALGNPEVEGQLAVLDGLH